MMANIVTLMLLVFCSLTQAQSKGKDVDHLIRIYGGDEAGEHEFPGQVFIRRRLEEGKIFFCSGSIISESWILSAGHCVRGSGRFYVQAGSSNRQEMKTRLVKRTIQHENYTLYGRKDNNAANDIGLLELSTPFILDGRSIRAISLPESREKPELGGGYVIVGWGRYNRNSESSSNQLKKLSVNVVPCPINYSDTKVSCIEYPGGTGPCSGDSGGPLLKNGVLYGIMSFLDYVDQNPDLDPNNFCDKEGIWAVLMPTADFRDWIRDKTGI